MWKNVHSIRFRELIIYFFYFLFYLLRTFYPHLGSFCVVSSFFYFFILFIADFILILVVFVLYLLHYISAKFHLWPSPDDLTATSDRNDQVNLWPAMEDQIRRTNNWIYKTKKSNLDRPSGPVAQRMEALSLYGSRWALSEDSGFNSYPSRPEVYLVKNVVR